MDKLDLDLEGRVLYPGGTYTSILAFVDGETAFPPSTPTGSESGGSRTGYETTCAYGSVTGYAACFSAALSGSKGGQSTTYYASFRNVISTGAETTDARSTTPRSINAYETLTSGA